MKKIAFLLALVLISAYTTSVCYAGKHSVGVSPAVYNAISKYKQRNYTGAIQDLTPIVDKTPDNAIAHYYLGVSYTQLGMKNKAEAAYNKVIEINTDSKLVDYSKHAVACLNNRPECKGVIKSPGELSEDEQMTIFIKSGKFMHDDVKKEVQEKSLDKLKDKINNDAVPDVENYKYLNDASAEIENRQPTDQEIANAVKVLAKVGFNPYSGMNTASYQNPQLAQLNAIMGNTNNTPNAFSQYLPYMMNQGTNQNPAVTKELMQAMLLNQMMPEFGFNNSETKSF